MRTPGFVAEKSFYSAMSDRPPHSHSLVAGIADPTEVIGSRGKIFPQAKPIMTMHCYPRRSWPWGTESRVCVCNEYEKDANGDWTRTKSYMC